MKPSELRDEFAIAAMKELIRNSPENFQIIKTANSAYGVRHSIAAELSKSAYAIADCMILARSK